MHFYIQRDAIKLSRIEGGMSRRLGHKTMEYLNAKDILPTELLEQVKKYAAGKYLYVPQNEDDMKSWGELSGYREQLRKRNRMMINKFQYGITIEELSKEYFLSEETVKKIVYSKKKAEELLFYPDIESAEEYDAHGLLEEWIHTYLLFERKNREFSDGLYLEERYYIGPIRMPVNFFYRSSGPEEGMKWRVDEAVFEERINRWVDKIKYDEKVPPLIISYFDNTFEINCNSPLHEALVRMGIKEFPVIIWITQRKDYEDFKQNYGEYVKFDYN